MITTASPTVVCPKCGCDDIWDGHHHGDWSAPEFSYNECAECEFRFGGDGPYADAVKNLSGGVEGHAKRSDKLSPLATDEKDCEPVGRRGRGENPGPAAVEVPKAILPICSANRIVDSGNQAPPAQSFSPALLAKATWEPSITIEVERDGNPSPIEVICFIEVDEGDVNTGAQPMATVSSSHTLDGVEFQLTELEQERATREYWK